MGPTSPILPRLAPLALIALVGGAALSCFSSGFLEGLPCMADDECGDLQCVDGVCGGGATASTTTTTGETSQTSMGTDSTAGTMTSTTSTNTATTETSSITTDSTTTTNGTATVTGNTATDTDSSFCGDGAIDPGEECDDGVNNGAPTSGCRDDCMINTCGDGVQGNREQCDEGPNNGGATCTDSCTLPNCGNGAIDPGEECDDGMANGVNADCTPNCKDHICGDGFLHTSEECDDANQALGDGCFNDCKEGRVIFVTGMIYLGGLEGLAGADAKCGIAAGKGNLAGTYKAWLSDSSESAMGRLSHATEPYRLVTGEVVAIDWNDLVDGDGLGVPINVTETGEVLTEIGLGAWTATTDDGSSNGPYCDEWMSSQGGVVGRVGLLNYNKMVAVDGWTNADQDYCSTGNRLYCIEQ